jgi:BASS family bile acid:Na+ symporter
MIAGLIMGLSYPVYTDFLMSLLQPFLMVMLLFVFIKTDVAQIFQQMKNYQHMAFIVFMFMVFVPVLLFEATNLFNPELAIGILLLTAMPAGAASPALTDIVKGNTALSTSILITTSIIAPFTVPVLFWALKIDGLSVSPLWIFKSLAGIIFLPLVLSVVVRRYYADFIVKTSHLFTSFNIFLLTLMVFAVIGSQRNVILNDFIPILWQTGFLYLVLYCFMFSVF